MRRQEFQWAYGASGLAQKAAVVVGGVVAAMLKADVAEVEHHLGHGVAATILSIQSFAWIYVPALLVLSWLFGVLRSRIGDPAVWARLHELISEYRDHMFTGPGIQQERRVTLFRYVNWRLALRRWPWDGWLVPVVRSGHTTQACRSIFRVPKKDSDGQGVAGLAWVSDKNVHIENLPDVRSPTRTEADIINYARAAKMTAQQVRDDPPQARSFYAIRIRIKGQPWGVIVMDSRTTTINNHRAKTRYKLFTPLLGHLLERL